MALCKKLVFVLLLGHSDTLTIGTLPDTGEAMKTHLIILLGLTVFTPLLLFQGCNESALCNQTECTRSCSAGGLCSGGTCECFPEKSFDAISFFGFDCEDDRYGTIDVEAVLGTWVRTETNAFTKTIEFYNDGTALITTEYIAPVNEGRIDTHEASWTLCDSILEIHEVDSETGEEGIEGSHAAIVDDVLYRIAYVKADGSTDELDGLWGITGYEFWDNHSEEKRETVIAYEVESLRVEGENYTRTITEFESWELPGDPFNTEAETVEYSGTIRVDGQRIFITDTERNGEEIPVELRVEDLFGFRIAPSVITFGGDPDGDPTDMGYVRR